MRLPLSSLAQVVTDENSRVDSSEVATDVLSIDDIIGEEQQLTQRKLKDRHFKGVWDYRSYLNISFANSKLDEQDAGKSGLFSGVIESQEYYGLFIKYTVKAAGQTLKVVEKNGSLSIFEPGDAVNLFIDPVDIMSY